VVKLSIAKNTVNFNLYRIKKVGLSGWVIQVNGCARTNFINSKFYNFLKTFKQDYAKLTDRPDLQMLMAQLAKRFDEWNVHHPRAGWSICQPSCSGKKSDMLNIPAVMGYGAKNQPPDIKFRCGGLR
jgi:hypothetical protein